MSNILSGKLRTTGRSTGYLFYLDENSQDTSVSFVDRDALATGLNFDKVEFEITGTDDEGRPAGRVTKIVERNRDVFVGQIKNVYDRDLGKRVDKFIPDDRSFYPTPDIANLHKFKNLRDQKILLKIDKWSEASREPLMYVADVLGRVGDNETEMKASVLDRGLPWSFPREVEQAAEDLKARSAELIAEQKQIRRDLTDRNVFTIDPADAKDFDDALSVHRLDNGNFEIGIHIADPSFYVRPGDTIDTEAVKRATSIYLVDRTIPMLPEVLSNDLCSLNPHEEKLTFTALFEITPQAEVVSRWFGDTVTLSKHRFTYQDAQTVLDDQAGQFADELQILSDLATIMKRRKVANGAIEFESVEVKFKLDENKLPLEVYPKPRLWTMEIIEEFMLLANREVTMRVALDADLENETDNPFIYRIHEKPRVEKLAEAENFLKTLGFELDLDGDGQITSHEINRTLKAHEGSDVEDLVSLTLLRSMKKAQYSPDNVGHFGLAFPYYTHFTSPIRRYPDFIVHRLLRVYLAGDKPDKKFVSQLKELSEHSSEMEVRAVDAERASVAFKYAQLFENKIGDVVEAIIFRVGKYGLSIEDKETKASGMINVRNMGGDYWEYDDKQRIMVGRNSNKKFRVGGRIKAKVLAVDIEKRQIDFELA